MIEFNLSAKQENPIAMLLGAELLMVLKKVQLAGVSALETVPAGADTEIMATVPDPMGGGWNKVYDKMSSMGFNECYVDDFPHGLTLLVKDDIKFYVSWNANTWHKLATWNSLVQYTSAFTPPDKIKVVASNLFKVVVSGYEVKNIKGLLHIKNPMEPPEPPEDDPFGDPPDVDELE
jgi:hypothetical protein